MAGQAWRRANQAPTIAGAPSANILEGELYEFMPTASDPDGDALEFSIARKPAWAQFDKASGRLWGTPGADDVGNFTEHRHLGLGRQGDAQRSRRSTSRSTRSRPASATLSWNAADRECGRKPLTDLAGYRIYYGRNPDNLTQVVVLNNPGLTRYIIENLTPATLALRNDLGECRRRRKPADRRPLPRRSAEPKVRLTPDRPARHAPTAGGHGDLELVPKLSSRTADRADSYLSRLGDAAATPSTSSPGPSTTPGRPARA